MEAIQKTPKGNTTTVLRIVARNFGDQETLIEQYGFKKRTIYLLQERIKKKYPEFLELYNPSVAMMMRA